MTLPMPLCECQYFKPSLLIIHQLNHQQWQQWLHLLQLRKVHQAHQFLSWVRNVWGSLYQHPLLHQKLFQTEYISKVGFVLAIDLSSSSLEVFWLTHFSQLKDGVFTINICLFTPLFSSVQILTYYVSGLKILDKPCSCNIKEVVLVISITSLRSWQRLSKSFSTSSMIAWLWATCCVSTFFIFGKWDAGARLWKPKLPWLPSHIPCRLSTHFYFYFYSNFVS